MICPNCEEIIKDSIAQCPHCGCHFPVRENKEEFKPKETPIVPPVVESKPVIEEKSKKEALPQIEEKQEVVVQDTPEAEVELVEEDAPQEPDFKFCKNCGKKINATAIFCKYCGKATK